MIPETKPMSPALRQALLNGVEPEFISLVTSGVDPNEAGKQMGLSYDQMRKKIKALKKYFSSLPKSAE
jgi:hypothetical protein